MSTRMAKMTKRENIECRNKEQLESSLVYLNSTFYNEVGKLGGSLMLNKHVLYFPEILLLGVKSTEMHTKSQVRNAYSSITL